jgi:hypothetical protein
MIAALFLALAVLASKPIPSAVITAKINRVALKTKGSVERTSTKSVPYNSVLFDDEEEVLISITTGV